MVNGREFEGPNGIRDQINEILAQPEIASYLDEAREKPHSIPIHITHTRLEPQSNTPEAGESAHKQAVYKFGERLLIAQQREKLLKKIDGTTQPEYVVRSEYEKWFRGKEETIKAIDRIDRSNLGKGKSHGTAAFEIVEYFLLHPDLKVPSRILMADISKLTAYHHIISDTPYEDFVYVFDKEISEETVWKSPKLKIRKPDRSSRVNLKQSQVYFHCPTSVYSKEMYQVNAGIVYVGKHIDSEVDIYADRKIVVTYRSLIGSKEYPAITKDIRLETPQVDINGTIVEGFINSPLVIMNSSSAFIGNGVHVVSPEYGTFLQKDGEMGGNVECKWYELSGNPKTSRVEHPARIRAKFLMQTGGSLNGYVEYKQDLSEDPAKLERVSRKLIRKNDFD